jgi:ABC-type transport system involved in multi-copper enzyme maturation permease subunit
MARHEAHRCFVAGRAQMGNAGGLAAAALLCLLIPLHRAYGGSSPAQYPPYASLFGVAVQIALVVLSARAVFVGTRRDAASGTLEELILTGIQPAQLLLGKWAGVSAAAALWVLMLLPPALFAAAMTGIETQGVALLLLAWGLSASAGALVGALWALSERSTAMAGASWFGFVQGWLFLRLLLPRAGTGLGTWWSAIGRTIRELDPISLVPSVLGSVHEPWGPKLLFLLALQAVGIIWLAAGDHSFPTPRSRRTSDDDVPLLSLRPMRGWLMGRRTNAAVYDRDVLFRWERTHGWRVRVSPPIWLLLLSPAVLVSLPLAILGADAHGPAVALAVLEVMLAAGIAGLGMAASLSAEREQGRWSVLLCAPLTLREIIRAKWRAAWLETWPLWAAGAGHTLLLALCGTLPWTAAPVVLLALPVAAGSAAAVAGALCARAPSLTAAQQRALCLLLAPLGAALIGGWLLPGLPGIGFISMPHLLASAQRFTPGFASPAAALGVLSLYAVAAPAGLWLTEWQLRRWPPV